MREVHQLKERNAKLINKEANPAVAISVRMAPAAKAFYYFFFMETKFRHFRWEWFPAGPRVEFRGNRNPNCRLSTHANTPLFM